MVYDVNMKKNKISTLGYFVKRMKDNGYVVWKIFDKYNIGDQRKWTVLINPGFHSLYITCMVNMEEVDDTPAFIFDDGNIYMRKNLIIKTNTIEAIVSHLHENGVDASSDKYKKT